MSDEIKAFNKVVTAVSDREGKYLTFSLAREDYGLGILKVKEIMGLMPVTSVPQTPRHVKGVVNLRGKVIPIVDLRLRFGLEETHATDKTCIIVVEVAAGSGKVLMGIIVDSVTEVLNVRSADIENAPSFGTAVDMSFILGMAKLGGGVKILLDIDKVLGAGEAEELAALARAEAA